MTSELTLSRGFEPDARTDFGFMFSVSSLSKDHITTTTIKRSSFPGDLTNEGPQLQAFFHIKANTFRLTKANP